jgi:hypothetical protein
VVAASCLRGRGPDVVGGADGKAFLVELDLECDRLQARGLRRDLGGHALLVLAQDGQALGLVACSLPDQFGVAADRQRDAGGAELDAQIQPVQVLFAVGAAAVAVRCTPLTNSPSRL